MLKVTDTCLLKASCIFLALPFSALAENDPFDPFNISDADINLVTPSLLSAASSESPVSVTKLTASDLELLGISNIVDALRLVPGMLIADEFGSGSVVGYHGTNVNVPRRMEVLFNGHSIYRPGYAGLNWQRLPLDIPDLTSIEIIRGASVVDFGSNAFQATVNLIQKPLATMPSAKLEASLGQDTHRIWAGTKYAFDNGQVFARFFQEYNSGFDVSAAGKKIPDDTKGKNILMSGIVDVFDNTLIDFSFMSKRYNFEFPGFLGVDTQNALVVASNSLINIGNIEDNSDHAVLKLSSKDNFAGTHIEWKIAANYTHVERKQPIRSCQPAYVFDPLLAKIDDSPNIHLVSSDFDLFFKSGFETGNVVLKDSIVNPLEQSDFDLLLQMGQRMQALGIDPGYEPICTNTNIDVEESRYAVNGRAKFKPHEKMWFSATAELRRDEAQSETYLGGETKSDSYRASASVQYAMPKNDLLNVGVMFEDNDRTGSALSYRVAYIHQIDKLQSVRLTYSDSKRLPDIYETERVWRFFHTFLDGFVDYLGQREAYFFRTSTSPEGLKAETNRTVEIGYQISGALNKYHLDAKLFQEEYRDMISEPFDFFDFRLSNKGENRLRGIEFGGHYQFDFAKIGASYLYLDSQTKTPFEGSLYSRHSGSVWTIVPITNAIYVGGTVTGNSDIGGASHLRVDTTLSYKTMLFNKDILSQLIFRRYPDEFRAFTEFSETFPNVIKYNNRNQVTINFSLSF